MTDAPPLELKGRQTAVYGLKGSGKSNWIQYVLSLPAYKHSHLVYDVCREHEQVTNYVPAHRRGDEGREELDTVVSRLVTGQQREKRPELLAIEEISRYSGSNSEPPAAVYELIDLARHYGTGLLTIGRRPAQVHTDITELADNIIIFRLTGDNDARKLDRIVDGLADVVRDLGDYEFVRVTPKRRVYVYDPVREMDTTGRL